MRIKTIKINWSYPILYAKCIRESQIAKSVSEF